MRKPKPLFYKVFVISLLLATIALTGCGGGEDNPVRSSSTEPVEYENANITVEQPNTIYTIENKDAVNIAVDVAADGADYLINIESKSRSEIYVELVPSASNAFSERLSVAEGSCRSFESYEARIALEAGLMARKSFVEAVRASKACSNTENTSTRASRQVAYPYSDHSREILGNEYTFQLENPYSNRALVTLNRCKLVHETSNAKFFVDQDSHGLSFDASKMESWIKGSDGTTGLAEAFDNGTSYSMYSVLEKNFGKIADVDGDGKVSILVSSVLTSFYRGLQGLFPYETMIVHKEDYPSNSVTDFRDLLIIDPVTCGDDAKGRQTMLNNLIHEAQHVVNFSARAFNSDNNYIGFDFSAFDAELGFDEGMSVCAEALFRRAWGTEGGKRYIYQFRDNGPIVEYAGNSDRFSSYTLNNIYPFNVFNPSYHYGRNGLFMLYLHDRFGDSAFKELIQQGWKGQALNTEIPRVLNCEADFNTLQKEWHIAIQNEYLRTAQRKTTANSFGQKYAYGDWLNLKSENMTLFSPSKPVSSSVSPLCYHLKATNKNPEATYRFFVKSSDGKASLKDLVINLIKLSE